MYCAVKKLKLDKFSKRGNKLNISFVTTLDSNNLNIKKSNLVFASIDGVSKDVATNFLY